MRKISYIYSVLILGACSVFPVLPEGSNVKGVLASDAMRNLRAYEQVNYKCFDVKVISAHGEFMSTDVKIENPGHYLKAGKIIEKWQVLACGTERSYKIHLLGNSGGHGVGIEELKKS